MGDTLDTKFDVSESDNGDNEAKGSFMPDSALVECPVKRLRFKVWNKCIL